MEHVERNSPDVVMSARDARPVLWSRLRTELAATAAHVRDFADPMRKRRGDRLVDWMHTVEADDLAPLHSLIIGLRRDLDAVVAGLTLPLKLRPGRRQRQSHQDDQAPKVGRASLELLRRRVLLDA